MKKNGFTLAEVLITLGIIGVIAALTLPTLSNNAQEQANAAKLSSTVSDLENAFGTLLVEKDELSLANLAYANNDKIYEIISPYLKTSGEISISSLYGSNTPFKAANGSSYNVYPLDDEFLTKTGAVILYEYSNSNADDDANGNVDKYAGRLYIDTNGPAKPNKLGKDLFYFHVGDNGNLYPYGNETKTIVQNGYKVK